MAGFLAFLLLFKTAQAVADWDGMVCVSGCM